VDGDPLHGFQTFHLTNVGGSPDYAKPGFNEDAIFISYNDFSSAGGDVAIASIDKAAALSGTLTYFVSHPKSQFRAMPPAQMHGDKKGGVEWFVSTDGTDAGVNTIRVTEMTNYLSNTPHFTYTPPPVTQYQSAQKADQPGGNITVFPNRTTTQVHYHLGRLVTAMASATASDGFVYPKGLYYQIKVNGGRPRLLKQGVIDPGPGVAVQIPSMVEDQQGNLGVTWMESSSSEYLSMWVGNLYTNGTLSTKPVAPGGGFFYVSSRIGITARQCSIPPIREPSGQPMNTSGPMVAPTYGRHISLPSAPKTCCSYRLLPLLIKPSFRYTRHPRSLLAETRNREHRLP
jgi:hypothetical protein